jgi:hypothetical protein
MERKEAVAEESFCIRAVAFYSKHAKRLPIIITDVVYEYTTCKTRDDMIGAQFYQSKYVNVRTEYYNIFHVVSSKHVKRESKKRSVSMQ